MKRLCIAAMVALFSLSSVGAAEVGQITGRIIDRASQQPLPTPTFNCSVPNSGPLRGRTATSSLATYRKSFTSCRSVLSAIRAISKPMCV